MSAVEYTWRDSELRSRPLRALNWVGAGWPGSGSNARRCTPASVTKAAAKMAGSDDFGSDSFREPLDVYLRACEDEAELTTFGRILISKMLAARWPTGSPCSGGRPSTPRCADERIERPWIIVGLPRTGTSLLSILLGLDPVARPLLQWEAAHPVPPPTLEEAAEDPRIARTAKDLEGLMKLNPPLKAMHPFGATLAEECVALFMYDVRTLALETQAHVPTLRALAREGGHDVRLRPAPARAPDPAVAPTDGALDPQDAQPPLAPRRPARRLSRRPGHLDPPGPGSRRHVVGQPGQRQPARPDQPAGPTPRPPRSGGASAPSPSARRWPSTRRPARAGASTSTTTRWWPIPSAPSVRCTGRFGEEVGPLHARRMHAFLEHRPQDAFGRHRYDPADFGWTYAGLAAEFADYTERYHIETADAPGNADPVAPGSLRRTGAGAGISAARVAGVRKTRTCSSCRGLIRAARSESLAATGGWS